MAKATSKAATVTTLAIGKVEVLVGLFKAHADPKKKLVEFDTAGPNGGVLKARAVARPVEVEETVDAAETPVHSDPLAGDPGSEMPPVDEGAMAEAGLTSEQLAAQGAQVDGEYGRELVEEGTGEVVLPQDVRRGVRREDGSFIDCTAQLEKIVQDTTLEKMDVVAFLPVSSVPRARVRGAYYVGAMDEKAPAALRLIFEALKRTRRCALVKVTKRSRQSLAVVGWRDKTLMMYELVWAEDFREPPARALAIQHAAVSEAQVEQAVRLIEAMSDSPAAMDELRDDAIQLREELHAKALRGEIEADVADVAAAQEDDSLMAELEASLAAVA